MSETSWVEFQTGSGLEPHVPRTLTNNVHFCAGTGKANNKYLLENLVAVYYSTVFHQLNCDRNTSRNTGSSNICLHPWRRMPWVWRAATNTRPRHRIGPPLTWRKNCCHQLLL